MVELTNIPECVVGNTVSLQDWEEFLFHAPIECIVVALVDSRLYIAIGLTNVDEFLQQLWLEVGDTKLENISRVQVASFRNM